MVKICKYCFKEYDDEDDPATPLEELGRIASDALEDQDAAKICPDCKEKLGILFFLGFGE
jgi:hypothetical protein